MTQEFTAARPPACACNATSYRLRPVLGTSGALGHVLMSAKGYRAFDRNDIEIGVFASAADAVTAILEST